MEAPAYYAIIPANVRYDDNLPPNAKLLYGEITALCNKEGYCWASNDYFANLYSVSIRSIKSWVKALSDNGYIDCEIIYKTNSKEVDKRIIRLSYPVKKSSLPRENNFTTPSEKNCTDNITSINTTINNITPISPKGDRQKKKEVDMILENRFEIFWNAYPKKVGKKVAKKAWLKLKPTENLLNIMLKAIAICKLSRQWQSDDGRYIPNPSTWLNQERWKDEVLEVKKQVLSDEYDIGI